MPGSTFSSDSSAVRGSSGLGNIISRFNTERGHAVEGERRVSIDKMAEMDGTGLHERDNWPLVERSVRNEDPPLSPKQGVEEVREDAVVRTPEDIGQQPAAHFVDKDVSDIDEESEDDSEAGTFYNDKESRDSSSVVRVEQASRSISPEPEHPANDPPPATNGDGPSSEATREQWRSLETPRQGSHLDVSPIRDADAPDASRLDEPYQIISAPNGGSPALREETPAQQEVSWDSEEQTEARDIATPIPFGLDGTSDPSSPNPSSPPAYGRSTPTNNGTGRPSSTFKGTPPSQNPSRRSQLVRLQRDRVRYSWQSAGGEEEPNRPRIHIIKLVSNTATASAGFPQGEALGFSISPGGKRIAAYNSARLYILQTAALPVGISQDFAVKRRPLAVEIVDEGNVLAILADEHTVNIYDLGHQQSQIIRTIKLDFPTNCIALAATGALLAAAYEGGVEIFSLASSALPTDRRAVRCPKMDRLMFSEDCSTLLGTTTRINVSATMVVSVPVFPSAGVPTHDELKEAWCSVLLHPENVRNSSHAVFMRENRETCNDRLFAWNGLEDTFGILNVSDMQYGNVDFPVVISPPLSTCGGLGAAIHSCPAIDEHGDTVAMIVNDRTIRLYIIPHKVEDGETTVEAHSIDHELDEGYGCPFSEARWMYSSASVPAPLNNQTHVQGRLVVTSPGGVVEPSMSEESVEDIEGGRVIMFDFDPQFAGQAGQTFSLTLGKSQPQLLEEPQMDVAEEVAIVRRRTVNQSKSGGLSTRPITLGRAASTFGRRDERSTRDGNSSLADRAAVRLSIHSETTRSLPSLVESESGEPLDAVDEPYAQNAPRSQLTLQRAASNAQRHRFQTLEERNQERVSVDSVGNFLPLPEYTEEPNAPLPSRFRALAGLDVPGAAPAKKPAVITNANGDRLSPASSTPSTAPAGRSETFSAEQAFTTATSRLQSQNAQAVQQSTSPTAPAGQGFSPIARSDTFSSVSSVPRSLLRAYGNLPSSVVMPSTSTATWDNVSPVTGMNQVQHFSSPSQSSAYRTGTYRSTTETLPEEQPWDAVGPATPRGPPTSAFARASTPNRYSTSLINPPGHQSPTRPPSSVSSFGPGNSSPTSSLSSHTRRLPPHLIAFRTAAAANASASLFPPSLPANHVPVREPSSSNAGSVPHPVTAWHPPAPSNLSTPVAGSVRGHSRKSSVSNRSAFASTEKAKKLGFFKTKKKKNKQLFGPEFAPNGGGAESMMETKSMFTTLTKGEGKCILM